MRRKAKNSSRFQKTLTKDNQGGAENAQNIPAQEETETEGARLQKENGYRRRQKRTQEKTRKRQKAPYLLIDLAITERRQVRQKYKTADVVTAPCRFSASGFLLKTENFINGSKKIQKMTKNI